MATRNQDITTRSSSSRFGGVRQRASSAGDQLNSRVEGAPLAAVAAGVAIGAIAGAILPRTDRETEILGPIGSKIGQAAAEAAKAARDAGKQELGVLSENKSPMEMLADKAVAAVSKAGSAAGSAAASKVTGKQDA
jgi:hypothetical protein